MEGEPRHGATMDDGGGIGEDGDALDGQRFDVEDTTALSLGDGGVDGAGSGNNLCETVSGVKNKTWTRVLPKKKAGGIGSRTLKGKNNKSRPRQAGAVVPEAHPLPITPPPAPSVTQLQRKVRQDEITKKELREKIRLLNERLDCAHSELVMLFDECDNNDRKHHDAIEQLNGEHSNVLSKTIQQHTMFLAKKDKDHAALLTEMKNEHTAEMAMKDAEHSAALEVLKNEHCVALQEKEDKLRKKEDEFRSMANRSLADRKAVNDMLEEKCAEADYEIEQAKLKMREAELIIVESKAKSRELLRAERAVTATTIASMARHHRDALQREQRDNDAVMVATAMRNNDKLANVRTLKLTEKQETINKLREEVLVKKREVTSLSADVKTTLRNASLEKEAMRKEHWKEKRLLFDKKKIYKRHMQKK
mmetsp:Transcript_9817/g.20904  ORF Transcript_9817/g.20904 Transcript_9817/m.20904 type:complete len:421 (-) Transcript_9817:1356-2618(-)